MTNEQPQDIQPTQADIDALAGKIDAFAATLTPGERAAFGHLLRRAVESDEDTQGYFFGTFPPPTPISTTTTQPPLTIPLGGMGTGTGTGTGTLGPRLHR